MQLMKKTLEIQQLDTRYQGVCSFIIRHCFVIPMCQNTKHEARSSVFYWHVKFHADKITASATHLGRGFNCQVCLSLTILVNLHPSNYTSVKLKRIVRLSILLTCELQRFFIHSCSMWHHNGHSFFDRYHRIRWLTWSVCYPAHVNLTFRTI